MTTTKATITAHVLTNDKEIARAASADFSRVLDSVWIVNQGIYTRFAEVAKGVWVFAVKVEAPTHELTVDAPIIIKALRATCLAYDSIRIV